MRVRPKRREKNKDNAEAERTQRSAERKKLGKT